MATVSVLVTARDNERHVEAAVRSVLDQSLPDLELLVVDDGSQDGTADVLDTIRDERLRVIRQTESLGISARRNELLELARAPFVAPLDADDVWMPHRLERHVEVLRARPELVAVGSDVLVVDGGAGVGPYWRLPHSDTAIRWCGLFTSPLIHSASTIRAQAFHDGVRYDPSYPLAQDFDLWAQLLRHGCAVNLNHPLTLYRVHRGQATQQRAAERRAEQERIGRAQIERETPGLHGEDARLAWCIGAGAPLTAAYLPHAVEAYLALLEQFAEAWRGSPGLGEARRIAATALVRRAGWAANRTAWGLLRAAVATDPRIPLSASRVRGANLVAGRRARGAARLLLADLDARSGTP